MEFLQDLDGVKKQETSELFRDEPVNRVVFCTSMLQVINARVAMDAGANRELFRDFVVITHAELPTILRHQISDLADELGFERVIDLSDILSAFSLELCGVRLSGGSALSRETLKTRLQLCRRFMSSCTTLLEGRIGLISELYFRAHYDYFESLLIRSFPAARRYTIEDGWGDYFPPFIEYRSLNFYAIKHNVRHWLKSGLLGMWASFSCIGYEGEFERGAFKVHKSYTNLDRSKAEFVGQRFRSLVSGLRVRQSSTSSKNVIIVGSLLIYPKFKFDVNDEIEIYNNLVSFIEKEHGVAPCQIWYKHHPRLSRDNWEEKRKKMKCRVFDYEDRSMIEPDLLNPELIAVYSVQSTAVLFAKKLFKVEAYFLDLKEYHCAPLLLKGPKILGKKYGISFVHIKRNGSCVL